MASQQAFTLHHPSVSTAPPSQPEAFGALLRRLRTAAGLSQQDLGSKANVSMQTIRRAEKDKVAAESDWRRTTALDVFRVLNNEAHLSDADRAAYLKATRLEGMRDLGARMLATVQQQTMAARAGALAAAAAFTTQNNPDHTTAHSWLQRMLDEIAAARVLGALEGLAASYGVDLPPRDREADPRLRGAWVHHTGPLNFGEGVRGEIYTPIMPEASAKATPVRKAAP